MHILIALPGLHRVERGAEIVFEALAQEVARAGRHQVTLVGSGQPITGRAYAFRHVPAVRRERFERWPKVPFLRSAFMYEDLAFAAGLAAMGNLGADLTVTCSYPWTSWALRRPVLGRRRPAHVFVTHNGDWPATGGGEARFFHCDGLVCINPVYYERNRARWPSVLIPNGIDPARFQPGPDRRAALGLPTDRPIVLVVSALDPDKRVLEAMRAVARAPDAFLLLAGDGPLRDEVDRLAAEILPGRFRRATFPRAAMPDLYRSADLLLHAKPRESFGMIYIEALCSGLPVVANDDEITRWVVEDHATLVDATDPQRLAAAVAGALAAPKRNPGAVAWAHDRYAWPRVAARYAEFFESVVKP